MSLSAKTMKVLGEAGIAPEVAGAMTDDVLLGVPGVGPAVLRDIREAYPLAPAATDTAEDLRVAAKRVLDRAAPPPPAVPAASPCTCPQPFRVTRTRQRAGRVERYCDACGAIMGSR